MNVQATMLLKMVAPNLSVGQLTNVVKVILSQEDDIDDEDEDSSDIDIVSDVDDEKMEVDMTDNEEDDDAAAVNPLQKFELSKTFSELKEDFDRELILAGIVEVPML
jgi:hypothetical protein